MILRYLIKFLFCIVFSSMSSHYFHGYFSQKFKDEFDLTLGIIFFGISIMILLI